MRPRSGRHRQFRKRSFLDLLIRRYGNHCWFCGESLLGDQHKTIEHLKPQSKGGNWDWENCRPAHGWCNSLCGNMSRAEKEALRADFAARPNRRQRFRHFVERHPLRVRAAQIAASKGIDADDATITKQIGKWVTAPDRPERANDEYDEQAERLLPCYWGDGDCDHTVDCPALFRPAVAAALRERDENGGADRAAADQREAAVRELVEAAEEAALAINDVSTVDPVSLVWKRLWGTRDRLRATIAAVREE